MTQRIKSGDRVHLTLPARLRVSIDAMPSGMRVACLMLTFDEDGRHVENLGTAVEISPSTLKAEVELEVVDDGHRQQLVMVALADGKEIPFTSVPRVSVAVEDGSSLFHWELPSSPHRTIAVLETYMHGGRQKLRSIDQGWTDGWTSFRQRTGCDVDLKAILELTAEDLRNPSTAHAVAPSGPATAASVGFIGLEAERLTRHVAALQAEAETLRLKLEDLDSTYRRTLARIRCLDGAEEVLEYAELGVYEPHFDFGTSEAFKAAIEKCRARQKAMIAASTAVVSAISWKIGNDEKAGKQMIDRLVKLTLRAFNGESDNAISNARWNNVVAMEKRISSSVAAIDKANATMKVTIAPAYVRLKIEELRLTHEYRDAQKKEREAATEERREKREQDKLDREVELAEREEQKFQRMLERARAEASKGDQTQAMKDRIARLETDLDEARREKERTKALAEQTKCGYVYVISNVGSFGEGIVKIGMTRRSDPMDRVRELSSASVPFSFDTHAMAYSLIASELESKLHRRFDDRRINVANNRKEFFRCTVDEVERAIAEVMPGTAFTRDREAREWRETMALRSRRLGVNA
jgi:hypothetical protein